MYKLCIQSPTYLIQSKILVLYRTLLHFNSKMIWVKQMSIFSFFVIFFSLIGLLTRSTKSTRRHALEIIANLQLMQQAYCYISNGNVFSVSFRRYLAALTNSTTDRNLPNIKLRHSSKCKDNLVLLYFPHSKIIFHNTLHFGRLRLSTRAYGDKKLSDDSNIIFMLNGDEYPGRIRSIFTIDGDGPYLLVAYLQSLDTFSCQVDINETFHYPYIRYTSNKNWTYIPIHVKDCVEKIVFFDNQKGIYYFFRFPTLEHCS